MTWALSTLRVSMNPISCVYVCANTFKYIQIYFNMFPSTLKSHSPAPHKLFKITKVVWSNGKHSTKRISIGINSSSCNRWIFAFICIASKQFILIINIIRLQFRFYRKIFWFPRHLSMAKATNDALSLSVSQSNTKRNEMNKKSPLNIELKFKRMHLQIDTRKLARTHTHTRFGLIHAALFVVVVF